MKKFFTVAALFAALTATSCGSNNSNELDSVSYSIGANLGQSLNYGMADFNLDNELVIETFSDFYKNGSAEDPSLMEGQQVMFEFQFTRLMPYLQALRSRESIVTDCPDTLPALPELYDETITREYVSEFIAKDMALSIKMNVGEDLDVEDMALAMRDVLAVENYEELDGKLRISMDDMNRILEAWATQKQAEAEAEYAAMIEENTAASEAWLAEIETMEGVQKTESGILYRIDREGDGDFATEDSDVVLVNYEGKTPEGVVFDSSYERGEPISFPLNRVIAGWTEGMKLVAEGGQITLWIPAELAYGEQGAGEDIEPNMALEFKVELLEVNPEE